MRFSIYLALLLIIGTGIGQSQNCDTELIVDKGRASRSISPDDGTRFRLLLTNRSEKEQTFNFVVRASDEACQDGIPVSNTSVLETGIFRDGSPINSLVIPAGVTEVFFVNVSRGSARALNSWYCVEVVASSVSCSDELSKKLSVYLSDGKSY